MKDPVSKKKFPVKRRSAKSYLKKPPQTKKPEKKSKESPEITPVDKPVKVPKTKKSVPEFYVGDITHYFQKISVVVVKVVEHPILIGDVIHIRGHSVDFTQKIQSLQVESKDVRFARKGELVGLQVIAPAKPGDKIFKIKK